MTLDEGYDIALVALACDDMHKDARLALGRIIDSRQDAIERADRAEAELARLKAEIHAAVQAAPDVMADLGDSADD